LIGFDNLMDAADRRLDGLPLENLRVRAGGRAWDIAAVRDQDRLLAAAGDWTPFPYGVLLWESAVVLGDVLAEAGLVRGDAVLELGAGTGLAGLVAAGKGAQVVQTDHSFEALALCRRNARANRVTGLEQRMGDWSAWSDNAAYDVVIGADVLYEPALYADILRVLETAVQRGGTAILTDPGRTHAGRFIDDLRDAGWTVGVDRRTVAALPPCEAGAMVDIDVIEARRAESR
jgi:predicted nicotinamide N-methyase